MVYVSMYTHDKAKRQNESCAKQQQTSTVLRKLNASTLDLPPLSLCWIRLQTDQACRYEHALCGLMTLDLSISGY